MEDLAKTPLATTGAAAAKAGIVLIVAAPDEIGMLRDPSLAPGNLRAELLALAADAPVPADALAAAAAVVLEVDPGNPASLDRLAAVRRQIGATPLIAALHEANVALVRAMLKQGVTDVAQLPFDREELVRLIGDAAARSAAQGVAAKVAPLVTVVGSTGGCGATTVLTHLAAALARVNPGSRGVGVIDLDLQNGEAAFYVGQTPRVTVTALLDAGERLDAELLRSAITDSQHGFSLIAAPEAITALDEVVDDDLLRLMATMREEFDYVLADLPTDWTGWALSVVLASTHVVMVTDLSVAGLRQAKRRLQLFDSIGVEKERIRLVANRVERRLFKPISLADAAEVLGMEFSATLADEDADMETAQNEGHLISDVRRRSRFASDIAELAQALITQSR